MKYDPSKHHRRSIRLKGYDYSQKGRYFVTICVQNRECLFGRISNRKMVLNDAGKMVEKWVHELENKFPDIICGEFIVMPNHFHIIIINTGKINTILGTDLRVCPHDITGEHIGETGEYIGETGEHLGETGEYIGELGEHLGELGEHLGEHGEHLGELGEHIGSPLHKIVQWFKTMSTNEYIRGVKTLGWQRFNGKLWQRNYWERIIRDDQSFANISNYIIRNPEKWNADNFR